MSSSTVDLQPSKIKKEQSLRRSRCGRDSWDDEGFLPTTTNVNNTTSSLATGSTNKTSTSESNRTTPDSGMNPESPPFCPTTANVGPPAPDDSGASAASATIPSTSSAAAKFLEIAQLNWATAQANCEAAQLLWSAAMIQHRDMNPEPGPNGCNFLRAAGAPIPTTSDPDGPGYCPVRLGKETGYMFVPNIGATMKASQEFTDRVLSMRP
ncbi:hypothetical protein GQ602_000479 [Ophiocordyceps camponoti-floridani]|uniref:Uncharacterized protein n=1 Tax=Ophiocordyceps camponoti-floridani TaxID=2030778 RepID=A0A8H4QC70_9HYPO|nr:hypothetical protein GQ602_000479 [Ophiocordyceps camponoti-floridani]